MVFYTIKDHLLLLNGVKEMVPLKKCEGDC